MPKYISASHMFVELHVPACQRVNRIPLFISIDRKEELSNCIINALTFH